MKHIFTIMLAVVFALNANAADLSGNSTTYEAGLVSPEVCQFSLTSYTGTVDMWGNTEHFRVGLSCPQQTDVRATVSVYIDNTRVASKVVTISAGNTYSNEVFVTGLEAYGGKPYTLDVK